MAETNPSRKRKVGNILAIHEKVDTTPTPVITFSERDMRYEPPRQDEPMAKLGLQLADLEACSRKLYGFAVEQVMIKGVIELETTFRECSHARTIPVLYTVVDVDASYNIIMGRSTLNKLGVVLSTLHLCMKYPADHWVARRCYEYNLRIGSQPSRVEEPDVKVLDLDLDPRCEDERERPLPNENLKEVSIGPKLAHKTRIGTTLAKEDESRLENRDVFAWSLADMPEIDPDFLCHHLSVSPKSRPIAQ
ncbi:hypothetical protein CR513_02516, partial [Mucuna pruriens]